MKTYWRRRVFVGLAIGLIHFVAEALIAAFYIPVVGFLVLFDVVMMGTFIEWLGFEIPNGFVVQVAASSLLWALAGSFLVSEERRDQWIGGLILAANFAYGILFTIGAYPALRNLFGL